MAGVVAAAAVREGVPGQQKASGSKQLPAFWMSADVQYLLMVALACRTSYGYARQQDKCTQGLSSSSSSDGSTGDLQSLQQQQQNVPAYHEDVLSELGLGVLDIRQLSAMFDDDAMTIGPLRDCWCSYLERQEHLCQSHQQQQMHKPSSNKQGQNSKHKNSSSKEQNTGSSAAPIVTPELCTPLLLLLLETLLLEPSVAAVTCVCNAMQHLGSTMPDCEEEDSQMANIVAQLLLEMGPVVLEVLNSQRGLAALPDTTICSFCS